VESDAINLQEVKSDISYPLLGFDSDQYTKILLEIVKVNLIEHLSISRLKTRPIVLHIIFA